MLATNDHYYIERYSNQADRLQPATGGSEVCHQAIPTSSTATVWEAELTGGDSVTGIKLFTTDSDNNKWYLRVPGNIDEQPDLVCSDHINHVSIYLSNNNTMSKQQYYSKKCQARAINVLRATYS